MVETCVLDTFAVLALLGGEPGSEEVSHLLRQAEEGQTRLLMTWVNVGEMAYVVERRWDQQRLFQVLAMLEATAVQIVPVERGLALAAAHIKAMHPVAYADAFAAALAVMAEATLVTGNRDFRLLEDILQVQWLPQSE